MCNFSLMKSYKEFIFQVKWVDQLFFVPKMSYVFFFNTYIKLIKNFTRKLNKLSLEYAGQKHTFLFLRPFENTP